MRLCCRLPRSGGGGDAINVIHGNCSLRGMARWIDSRVGQTCERRIAEVSQSVAAAFGCQAEVRFERRTPATINDPAAARFVRAVVSDCSLTLVDARPSMASEDFAYMLAAKPGCYIWLGAARPDENFGLHSARYDFNDAALPFGAALWISLIRRSIGGPLGAPTD